MIKYPQLNKLNMLNKKALILVLVIIVIVVGALLMNGGGLMKGQIKLQQPPAANINNVDLSIQKAVITAKPETFYVSLSLNNADKNGSSPMDMDVYINDIKNPIHSDNAGKYSTADGIIGFDLKKSGTCAASENSCMISLGIVLDPNNKITETNENNNSFGWKFSSSDPSSGSMFRFSAPKMAPTDATVNKGFNYKF